MSTTNRSSLGPVLTSFFNDHLKLQKGLQPNSIKSYADAMRLFLKFATKATGKRITQLCLNDLDADVVVSFLNSLEQDRDNAPQSRNQRLAALQTFFEYVGSRFPDRLEQVQKIAAVPRKRVQATETIYLERDEIEEILAVLPAEGRTALRDRTLLLFLYNTGARVQETAELSVGDVQFQPTPWVHLHGKGDKWRICPLWEETAGLLHRLLAEQDILGSPERAVFAGPRKTALTRFGIYKIVRRHTQQFRKYGSDGRSRHISPHVWRHSTAVHLLEAGVEVNVIRAWLGHASLETTDRYAEITIRTKQAALEKCSIGEAAEGRIPQKPLWRTDESILSWLQSL